MMKKLLLIFFFLVIGSGLAGATVTFVNFAGTGSPCSGSTCKTAALNVTSGNLLVVTCFTGQNACQASSVTDTAGNTYHQCTSCYNYSKTIGSSGEDIWYAYNITGNSSNVAVCNLSATTAYPSATQSQYSGVSTTSPFQVGTNNAGNDSGGGSTVTTSSFNPSNNGLAVAAAYCDSGPNLTAGTNYTIRSANPDLEDWTAMTSGSQTASFNSTSGQACGMGVATFSAAGSAPVNHGFARFLN